ncbi:MAG: dTDP-4-dehydrorhamnose 3,5-epimerase [Holophagales bacterium]|nr:dTDP-4-dehydrorhamnose 3,5-epimerase [Holophagales bacterium]
MRFRDTSLEGVLLIEPTVFQDDRGFFLETYHRDKYRDAGLDVTFVQDNHSKSAQGTLRGLHAQSRRPQGKLVRAIEGEIFDVAVDMRRGSPTFGQWTGEVLSADNFRQLYIPPDFLHGFYVLSEVAQVEYKCTDVYDPGHEIGVLWNDPEIGIDWPLRQGRHGEVLEPLLSAKDAAAPRLAEVEEALLPPYPGTRGEG